MNLCLQKARRRRPCEITLAWLMEQWERQQGCCYYTGWPMALSGDKARHPTIERVDSLKDYTEDNVVLCCRQVNWAKNDYTFNEFLMMCGAVVASEKKRDSNREYPCPADLARTPEQYNAWPGNQAKKS